MMVAKIAAIFVGFLFLTSAAVRTLLKVAHRRGDAFAKNLVEEMRILERALSAGRTLRAYVRADILPVLVRLSFRFRNRGEIVLDGASIYFFIPETEQSDSVTDILRSSRLCPRVYLDLGNHRGLHGKISAVLGSSSHVTGGAGIILIEPHDYPLVFDTSEIERIFIFNA